MLLDFLGSAVLSLALLVQGLSAPARSEDFTFRIPPQRIPLSIENQPLTIDASGIISVGSKGHDEYILRLELDADLSDLQQNMTGLLQSQLDKDDPCGDHISIEHATLTPVGPFSRAVVQLHYDRYTCVKAFGKRVTKKLVGGNGIIQLKFTPTVEDRKTLQLVPEVESIQADGSLGELLKSGPIGAMVREKISRALLAAMQKGTDRSLTLPPAVQDIAMIDKAQFEDKGSGRLGIALQGEVTISAQQVQLLKNQLKERAPAR
ncbi:MAG TPA: hypothetical protein VI455_18440 [Terriglobia bacterium]